MKLFDDFPLRRGTHSLESTSNGAAAPHPPQLPDPVGVSTGVSSVAIENGLLSMAERLPSADHSAELTSRSVMASDAEVMLRVKSGDEAAFTFLIEKYRRQIVGFMYRMCHNPASAEELAGLDAGAQRFEPSNHARAAESYGHWQEYLRKLM